MPSGQCAAEAYCFRVHYVQHRPRPPIDAFVEYFAGLTPTQYLRQRSEHVKDNHLPLVRDGSSFSNTGTA